MPEDFVNVDPVLQFIKPIKNLEKVVDRSKTMFQNIL